MGAEDQDMRYWFDISLVDISCCNKFGTTNIIGAAAEIRQLLEHP